MDVNDVQRLNRLEEKLDRHGEDIAAIKEQNKTIFSKLQSIDKRLFGNGI